jgi:hypothetical protein
MKVITKVIYISVLITTCFDPYWVIIRCASVKLEAEFFVQYGFIFDHMIIAW